jgi:hypothetical protein
MPFPDSCHPILNSTPKSTFLSTPAQMPDPPIPLDNLFERENHPTYHVITPILPTRPPFPSSYPSSRVAKVKEFSISTLERRLRTRRRRHARGRHLRRQALRLLGIALADRQRLVAAGVGGLRARVVLVVAGARRCRVEIREGRAVDLEGGLGVARLRDLASRQYTYSFFRGGGRWRAYRVCYCAAEGACEDLGRCQFSVEGAVGSRWRGKTHLEIRSACRQRRSHEEREINSHVSRQHTTQTSQRQHRRYRERLHLLFSSVGSRMQSRQPAEAYRQQSPGS